MSEREEFLILVDAEDRETGSIGKLEGHRRGLLHRAFSILIWSNDGRMLLQQRYRGKYHSGGLWTNACCGHPRPGEDVTAAAHRRLKEELGFDCPLSGLGAITYRAQFANGLIEHEVVHIYRGLYEGSIDPDPQEVQAIAWKSLDDIRRDIAAAPARYSVWFERYIDAEWPTALAPPLQPAPVR